jgi:hypothetical protein
MLIAAHVTQIFSYICCIFEKKMIFVKSIPHHSNDFDFRPVIRILLYLAFKPITVIVLQP